MTKKSKPDPGKAWPAAAPRGHYTPPDACRAKRRHLAWAFQASPRTSWCSPPCSARPRLPTPPAPTEPIRVSLRAIAPARSAPAPPGPPGPAAQFKCRKPPVPLDRHAASTGHLRRCTPWCPRISQIRAATREDEDTSSAPDNSDLSAPPNSPARPARRRRRRRRRRRLRHGAGRAAGPAARPAGAHGGGRTPTAWARPSCCGTATGCGRAGRTARACRPCARRSCGKWPSRRKPAATSAVHGLVLLSLADGSTRFAIGAGDWRWSDLLGVRATADGDGGNEGAGAGATGPNSCVRTSRSAQRGGSAPGRRGSCCRPPDRLCRRRWSTCGSAARHAGS